MFEGYEKLPLPPPWRYVTFDTEGVDGSEVHYVNDITNDITTIHPLLRLIAEREEAEEVKLNAVIDEDLYHVDTVGSVAKKALSETVGKDTNCVKSIERNRRMTNCEFKCEWKEIGLFGDRSVFGLTIRYDASDASTSVRFDGIEAGWKYSALEGPYGPITRNDLFVGSKIKIFGRSLAISSANREAVQWIEKENERMLAHRLSMQTKIEKCGSIPVVPRIYVPPLSSFRRDGLGFGGKCDLRKLHNENARLGEQLVKIGITHPYKKS